MRNAIEVKNLTKHFKTFTLDTVSFTVPRGYITGFIGPNGSGKTTTIKSMLSMIKADGGEIQVLGKTISSKDVAYMQEIGVVMDSPTLVKEWTMVEVNQVFSLFYSNWDETCFFNYLKRFSIDTSLRVQELSRGMGVKLMIAVALSHEAKILILDEPTSGLDPVAREEVCDLLQEFVCDEAHTVLFSTHITSDLEAIADNIVFILNGSILYSGPTQDLLERYVIVKGGLDDLEGLDASTLIGLKKHSTGFECMMLIEKISSNSNGLLIEPITLDQIIIFFNRGGTHESNS
ncbi:hypothetical protein AOC36_01455 [Erysipelothrix larvae]|uniref:ABC transporter domain-containing protein n=1 Tax=Erysipelothrix larvae TaxID=1514105 RepID=A0A0X8GYP3_9FIRM|nr:ABC transporter ATP-binding protein [Erysipelothrix larvae]AMC92699.1 hypothetical protein AOC36_01455 [Erysipelothrix larvae]